MNRSLLIIICDFWLLTLLALARFDVGDSGQEPEVKPAEPHVGRKQDLVDVLRSTLDEERLAREQLSAKLASTENTVKTQEEILSERERRMRQTQLSLQEKEQEARRLAAERQVIAERYTATQTNVARLQDELKSSTSAAQVSRERLTLLEASLKAREEEARQMQEKLTDLEKNRQLTEKQRQELASQLQVVEVEKRMTREQLDTMRSEVQTVRAEKAKLQETTAKLTEGVTELAQSSTQLTQEVREHRPIAANSIFNNFITNRLQTVFQGRRPGVFGQPVNREKQSKTILARQGNQIFAIYHLEDTPLTFANPTTDWESFTGTLRRDTANFAVSQVSFLALDPRVVVVPVTEAQARRLGTRIYPMAADPFKFQEAVLVGASEGYFGECKFQLDAELPRYVKMPRGLFNRVAGNFLPSRGDLVFTKSGELLGLMVTKEYCVLLNDLSPAGTIQCGPQILNQKTGKLLAQMQSWVDTLPVKFQ